MPYTQWPTLALDIFDYVVKMNKHNNAKYERKNEEIRQDDLQQQKVMEQEEYMRQRSGQEEF